MHNGDERLSRGERSGPDMMISSENYNEFQGCANIMSNDIVSSLQASLFMHCLDAGK